MQEGCVEGQGFEMNHDELSKLQALLAEVFEFSPTDIAANRTGKISRAQRARMARKHYANSRLAWVSFAIIFGLGLLGASAEMIRLGHFGANFLQVYFGVTALFGLIVWAFVLHSRHRMRRTLREGNVRSARGSIQIIGVRVEKLTHWYFCVGNHRFEIDRSDHRILLQQSGVAGREGTVHFSVPWKDLLSVVLSA